MSLKEVNLKEDLEILFKNFKWNIVGIVDNEEKVHPIPKIPQVITGIFEHLGMEKIINLGEKYGAQIEYSGSREYPDLSLTGGKLDKKIIAFDIKSSRRNNDIKNRCSRMSLGSCAGYFLEPNIKKMGCKRPYSDYSEHWIVGIIYKWNPEKDGDELVSDISIVIQEKWKIASKSTATGDTAAMGSITNIDNLHNGKGEFESESDFETFWRQKGKGYKR